MHLRKRANVATIPVPKVVPATGSFDGNDGNWSTFFINANCDADAVNGQDFRVLISTSSSVVLLPGRTNWCTTQACADERGVGAVDGKSQLGMVEKDSWVTAGIYEIPTPDWYSDDLKGGNFSLRGTWGKTNIGLGKSSTASLVLGNRYAVEYIFEEYFMGSFGLAMGAVGGYGAAESTFLSQFDVDDQIASLSYGYTAGAYYRNNGNGAPGNLVLGGYDKSRMAADKAVSISMPNSQNTTLAIGVPSILYSTTPGVSTDKSSFTDGCGGGFSANIDSTLPYLILPDCICDQFQRTFGLTYDETQNLYFVNSTAHERNVQQNATVEFKIAKSSSDTSTFANIQLGYSAFDQQWTPQVQGNATIYFPIKKSKNERYTLGRTFLQEAYIVVDYERLNFTVAPAFYADPMPKEDLKMIYNLTYNPLSDKSNSGNGLLAPGAIAGTVVGIVVAFIIAGVIAFCWWRKRKSKEAAKPPYEASQIDPTLAGQEIKYRRVSELTGSDLPGSPKTPIGGYYTADHKSVPPISEMSPDSPPVELYSPPPESASDVDGGRDYFTAGKPHRRGAQRDRASSGHNTPGTPPIAELPGDEGRFYTPGTQHDGVSPLNSPLHSRGPSDTSLSTNIDERLADHKKDAARPVHPVETATADEVVDPKHEAQPADTEETSIERRPSHQRGLSDTTIASDSTAVSQPTPEERERWANDGASPRPLSQ